MSFKIASNSEKPLSGDITDGILTVIDSDVLIELNYLGTKSKHRVS